MILNLLNRQRCVKFHIKWARGVLEESMETTVDNANAEVTVAFVSDKAIRKLNKKWRNIDSATDCLSFPMHEGEDEPDDYLGDIAISLETALRQSKTWFPDHPEQDALIFEVTVLFVHSLLHLSGYDHIEDEDRKIMTTKEKDILTKIFPDVSVDGLTQR